MQRIPMLHTFDGPYYTKNEKYMKNVIAITFFMYFSFFMWQGLSIVCNMGTPWIRNQIMIQRVFPLEIWVNQ